MNRPTAQTTGAVSQRPEYTSRRNIGAGRHGWLRLTPAYSVYLVEEILQKYSPSTIVFDPFSGTGTTALCASTLRHKSISLDINPFLVWLTRTKVASYSQGNREEVLRLTDNVCQQVRTRKAPLAAAPKIHNLERWWNPKPLEYLRRIKGALATLSGSDAARNLMRVALCRTIIETASVTRAHQSLSFTPEGSQHGIPFEWNHYSDAISVVLASALENPAGRCSVLLGDARKLSRLKPESVDLVITSPPYPNRITSIRELRPYMYWLDFIHEASDAGELDWKAIGGTWGVATSRLATWEPGERAYIPSVIHSVCQRISKECSDSAKLLKNYVLRYFVDITTHLSEMKRIVRGGGKLHYLVGNSSFYGHIVETEKAYVEILNYLGFRHPEAYALRKRNSKSELFEFVVSAERP